MQQTSLKLWAFSAPAINRAIARIVFGPTESTFLQNALYLTEIPEYIPILLFHFQLDYTRLSIRCDLGLSLPSTYFSLGFYIAVSDFFFNILVIPLSILLQGAFERTVCCLLLMRYFAPFVYPLSPWVAGTDLQIISL